MSGAEKKIAAGTHWLAPVVLTDAMAEALSRFEDAQCAFATWDEQRRVIQAVERGEQPPLPEPDVEAA